MKTKIARIFCLLLCLFLLGGCQKETLPKIKDGDLIVYPGVSWNASPEDVLSSINLTLSDVTVEVDDSYAPGNNETSTQYGMYTFTVDDVALFGQTAKVAFQFDQYRDDGALGLGTVMVIYPDTTDMKKVQKSIEACLGTPTNDQVNSGLYLNLEEDSVIGHVVYWDSIAKYADYVNPDTYQALSGHSMEEDDGTLFSTPAVRLFWTDDVSLFYYGGQMEGYDSERYMLKFVAYYTEAQQIYG